MRRRQAGFTLVELLIAITLVAAISAGLLTAMRNGLLTMGRTQQRLNENRRALGIQDLIRRQIGGAMPAKGQCGSELGLTPIEIFRGNASSLLLVSNESMLGGSRGYPQIALYQVRQNPDGTVRLELTERLFSGPASTVPFCDPDPRLVRVATGEPPVVLLDHLAYCRFLYQNMDLNTLLGREPIEDWQQPLLPYAVKINLAPAPGSEVRMPVGNITIPLRISRSPGVTYFDQ